MFCVCIALIYVIDKQFKYFNSVVLKLYHQCCSPVLPNTNGGAQESDASAVRGIAAGGTAFWHGGPQLGH